MIYYIIPLICGNVVLFLLYKRQKRKARVQAQALTLALTRARTQAQTQAQAQVFYNINKNTRIIKNPVKYEIYQK